MTTEDVVSTPDGARLWTEIQGSGPPVVLCHGGPGLWDYFGALAADLSGEFTVYRWDQRACGRSTSGTLLPSTRQTLEDLDFLRARFGHERWSVVGHSWGAEIALLYALLFKDHVNGVVYVSGRGTQGWWEETGRSANRENVARRTTPEQSARLSTLSASTTRDADEEVEFRWLSWRTDFVDPDGNKSLDAMCEAPFSINFEVNRALASDQIVSDDELLAHCVRTEVPMLFIHGAEDPRPVEGPRELADAIATATLHVIAGASHLPWVERPEVVSDTVKPFLRNA